MSLPACRGHSCRNDFNGGRHAHSHFGGRHADRLRPLRRGSGVDPRQRRAAAADVGVEKLVVYETPYKTDPDAKYPVEDYGARLEQIVAEGDPMRAVKHLCATAPGFPLRS
jgi:hypothetical protein